MSKPLNIISLGAGWQSSAVALMAEHGEFDVMPDCAIFSDTQAEPKEVYEWLDWLITKLSFPVHIVTAGNLYKDSLRFKNSQHGTFQTVCWRTPPSAALGRRQCTKEYKLMPLYKKLREMGAKHTNPVNLWIGISMDEAHRMSEARVKYVRNYYPLIEKHIYRGQCGEWIKKHYGVTPPRSACVFCPMRNNAEWKHLKDKAKGDWRKAVAVDNAIRDDGTMQYAHRSLVPLIMADLDEPEDKNIDMFGEECEGMCGI